MNEHARVIGVIRVVGTRVVDANDVFLEMVGYTRRELDAGDCDWSTITPPEYLRREITAFQLSAEQGGFTVPVEKYFVRKDGNRLNVLLVRAFLPDTPDT